MRGIAAFAVVLAHAYENLPDRQGALFQVLRATPVRTVLDGRHAVIFFFVLSGLVLTRSLLAGRPPGFAVFALRRAIRLCVPALATLLISVALWQCFHDRGTWIEPESWLSFAGWTRPPDAADIARQALLIAPEGDYFLDCVLWTLVHELRFSILLPIVMLIVPRNGGALLAVSVALLLGLEAGSHGLNGGDRFGSAVRAGWLYGLLPVVIAFWIATRTGLIKAIAVPGWPLLAACVLAGFALGAGVGENGRVMVSGTFTGSLLATAFFAPCFLVGVAQGLGGLEGFKPRPEDRFLCLTGAVLLLCYDNLFATVMASVLLIVAAGYKGRMQTLLRTAPLVFLGRISFSLYLIHVPVIFALHHALHDVVPHTAILILGIILPLPAAWALHRLVEQPAQLLARRVGWAPMTLQASQPNP